MTKPQVKEKLIKIVVKQLSPKDGVEITDATHFVNDLQADSLDSVELAMEIGDAFDIELPDDDVSKLQTVGATIDYVFNALIKKRG